MTDNTTDNFTARKQSFLDVKNKLQKWLNEKGFSRDADKLSKTMEKFATNEENLHAVFVHYMPEHKEQKTFSLRYFHQITEILPISKDTDKIHAKIITGINELQMVNDLADKRKIPLPAENPPPKNFAEAIKDFRELHARLIQYLEKEGFKNIAKQFAESGDVLDTAMTNFNTIAGKDKSNTQIILENISVSNRVMGTISYELNAINNYVANEDTRKSDIIRTIHEACNGMGKLATDLNNCFKEQPPLPEKSNPSPFRS